MFIVCEKPFEALKLLKLFENATIFCFNSYSLSFDYENFHPEKIPTYKLKEDNYPYRSYTKKGYICYETIEDLQKTDFVNLSKIHINIGVDHSSVRCIDFYLKNIHKYSRYSKVSLTSIYSFEEKDIIKAFNNRTDFFTDLSIKNFRNHYIKKDYLDYHMNEITKKIFGYSLTKNMFRLIALLSDIYPEKSIKESTLLGLMSKLKIGSVASRTEIINKLDKLGIIKSDDSYINKLHLTNKGFCLISRYPYFFDEDSFIYLNNLITDVNIDFEKAKATFDEYVTYLRQ
jgi:hypothetical protein